MPSAVEYADMLRVRLPEGPAWNTSDETDGETAWDGLLAALAEEPARVDEDMLSLLDQVVPDNADTALDSWEAIVGKPLFNLTDEERLARIRSLLQPRGNVNLETLQHAVALMAGDDNVVVYNRARPKCAAGKSNAGDGCGAHGYAWRVELYPNVLDAAPDGFASWAGFDTVANNDAYSPVTLAQTAATAGIDGLTASVNLLGTEDGDTVYASFWIRPDVDMTLVVSFSDRAGLTTASLSVDLEADVWRQISYEASVGTGSNTPALTLDCAATVTFALSWAVAGIRDAALEARIRALFPIHTRGAFSVQGEFATLLAQDQTQVTF